MQFDYSTDEIAYRERTTHQGRCAGIMSPSFMCRRCKQNKRTSGRKPVAKGYPKLGYVCADCAKGD